MAWTWKRSLLAGFAVYVFFVALIFIDIFFSEPANQVLHWIEQHIIYSVILTEWFVGAVLVVLGLYVLVAILGFVHLVVTTVWGVLTG